MIVVMMNHLPLILKPLPHPATCNSSGLGGFFVGEGIRRNVQSWKWQLD